MLNLSLQRFVSAFCLMLMVVPTVGTRATAEEMPLTTIDMAVEYAENGTDHLNQMKEALSSMSDQELSERMFTTAQTFRASAANPEFVQHADQLNKMADKLEKMAKEPTKAKRKFWRSLGRVGKGLVVTLSIPGTAVVGTFLAPLGILAGFAYGLSGHIDTSGGKDTMDNIYVSGDPSFILLFQFLFIPGSAVLPAFIALFASAAAVGFGEMICESVQKADDQKALKKLCKIQDAEERALRVGVFAIGSTLGAGVHYVVGSPYYGIRAIVRAIKKRNARKKAEKAAETTPATPVAPALH